MVAGPVRAETSSSSGEAGGESASIPPGTFVLSVGKDEKRAEGGSGGRRGSAERERDGGGWNDPEDESDIADPGPRMVGTGGNITSSVGLGCDETERPDGERGIDEP